MSGSVNVVIGRMVKCHNWTDGQMSQSDPEAIRGIRALPGPRPISVPNYCSREGGGKLARTEYFYHGQNSALKKKAAWIGNRTYYVDASDG